MAPDLRVAVTGLGIVSPIGVGRDAFWDALFAGRSGIGPLAAFEPVGCRSRLAGEVRDFDPAAILGRQGLRLLDRTTRLALGASALALADAGLSEGRNGDEVGIALGTMAGSASSRGDFCAQAMRDGIRGVNPALFPNTVVNSPASQVAIRFGAHAFNATIAGAGHAALEAIEYGAAMIRLGHARVVLAGGAEELSPWTYEAFDRLGLLARETPERDERAAPFARGRNGLVLGEGAAMFVLESVDAARRRGATIYAEYHGGASATDLRVSDGPPAAKTIARAIGEAVERAGVAAREIDWVAVGASGSVSGDRVEARGLQLALAPEGGVRASAVKAQTGDALGAGGAFQIATALGSFARDAIPPTLNAADRDPRCPVTGSGQAEARRVNRVLVTACGTSGQASALVLARPSA
ncbi:MAG TPA: beta-ketoacyl synthase N-terminal-like domain-containing protein [Vicinamibacterales bacterium]|nr:beta-ketoacyl synthase N-terminal-like domain-containing protein [Vicinamibacterales bacterium]